MTGLGLLSEGHLLVLAGDHATQKALGLLADALTPFAVSHAPCVLLLAVPAQADLSHDALKQSADIVMERCRGLDELTVEHDSTCTALYKKNRGKMNTG